MENVKVVSKIKVYTKILIFEIEDIKRNEETLAFNIYWQRIGKYNACTKGFKSHWNCLFHHLHKTTDNERSIGYQKTHNWKKTIIIAIRILEF